MPEGLEPFDAAMRKLADEVAEGVQRLHPVKAKDLEAARLALRQQFAAAVVSSQGESLWPSVTKFHSSLLAKLRGVISTAISNAAVVHPAPDFADLLSWNLAIVACLRLSTTQVLPICAHRLTESGRLRWADIHQAHAELNSPIALAHGAGQSSSTIVDALQSVLEQNGLEPTTARQAATALVPIIIAQVQDAPMDSLH